MVTAEDIADAILGLPKCRKCGKQVRTIFTFTKNLGFSVFRLENGKYRQMDDSVWRGFLYERINNRDKIERIYHDERVPGTSDSVCWCNLELEEFIDKIDLWRKKCPRNSRPR